MIKTEEGEIKPYFISKSQNMFVDGSFSSDLPMQRMSELFNINTFIVCQVNPNAVPFLNSDGLTQDKSRLTQFVYSKG